MPRPKSLLKSFDFDYAKKSHTCQHNRTHKINKGDKRLKLKVNRTIEYFCLDCARKIITSDIKKLNNILDTIDD